MTHFVSVCSQIESVVHPLWLLQRRIVNVGFPFQSVEVECYFKEFSVFLFSFDRENVCVGFVWFGKFPVTWVNVIFVPAAVCLFLVSIFW